VMTTIFRTGIRKIVPLESFQAQSISGDLTAIVAQI
jgi:hypothetical protein